MSSIAASIPDQLPLARIETVTFYKRDELTTDLICCDVEIAGRIRFFHEEQEGWDALLTHLEKLPGFRRDWRDTVMPPPFARNQFTAFEQPDKVT
ncbi:MAG TPA: hypothetical protein VFW19_07915 [Allosphingosinicella sp.]|nr:hypothetical protein [Allosphingosinicella sp.]